MKRWRKEPNETGLRRVCQAERGYELRENGETIIYVAPISCGWYWYGLGKNTCKSPRLTVEEAKAEAMEWVKIKESQK